MTDSLNEKSCLEETRYKKEYYNDIKQNNKHSKTLRS